MEMVLFFSYSEIGLLNGYQAGSLSSRFEVRGLWVWVMVRVFHRLF
jgi:hypothetical protein